MTPVRSLSYRFSPLISGKRLIAIITACVLLTACADWLPEAHRLDITQGNVVTPEQVQQLKPGMPKAEVRALIGVPVLEDPFHDQRWDYIFRYLPGKGDAKQSRLTVHFEEDIVVRIDDSEYVDPDTLTPPPDSDD